MLLMFYYVLTLSIIIFCSGLLTSVIIHYIAKIQKTKSQSQERKTNFYKKQNIESKQDESNEMT